MGKRGELLLESEINMNASISNESVMYFSIDLSMQILLIFNVTFSFYYLKYVLLRVCDIVRTHV